MNKLTRQERKEALAEWDRAIAGFECLYDANPAYRLSYAKVVETLQMARATELAELEGSAK